MMLKKGVFLLLLMTGTVLLSAQEGCDYEPSAKVQKLLEKAKDKKKYDADKRREFYEDALDEEEDCLPCLHALGASDFKKSKRSGASFQSARYNLEQLIEKCEAYHSEPYYFLGAICYAEGEYEQALTYFDKFIHFPDDDESKFNKDYDKKYEEVQEAIPYVEFYRDFYKNEDVLDPQRVEGVSSNNDDYLPAISPDGEIMFYTRKLDKKAKGDYTTRKVEEFTWSFRSDINQPFDAGEPLPRPFNMGDNYGGATISVDNKEMIIAKKNPAPGNPENVDLFTTRYEYVFNDNTGAYEYQWQALESIGDGVNTEDGWEAQPSLSGDGQRLFYAKVGPECIQDANGNFSHDIFVSIRNEDGSWGPGKPIKGGINTPGQEKSPFMHSDSKTLYFSSDGHLGGGGMDIFYCKMNDGGSFSKPKNMGAPVNTNEDETGLIVSSDGEEAFFFSRRIKGSRGYDIYAFTLPEEARPEKVMILKGEAKDENGEPAQGAVVELNYVESKKASTIKVDAADGKYAAVVNIENNESVTMTVKAEDVAFNSRLVNTPTEEEKPAVMKLSVQIEEIALNKPFVINDIYYETNKALIDPDSKAILDRFAEYLEENPNISIEIRGHTDNVGSDAANMALSLDRAFEVLSYLSSKGIKGSRLKANGYGETKPVASNESEEGRAKNRRTEFVVTRM